MAERMVQIGVTALRDPSGGFLPSIPLFIREEDAGEINPATGRTLQEDLALTDVAKVFADKFKQYADGNKKRKRRDKPDDTTTAKGKRGVRGTPSQNGCPSQKAKA